MAAAAERARVAAEQEEERRRQVIGRALPEAVTPAVLLYPKFAKLPQWRGKATVINHVRRFVSTPRKQGRKRDLDLKHEFILV